MKAFMGAPPDRPEAIETLVRMAERARREGLLALEDAAKGVNNPFLRRGLEMAIDGTDPEELGEILHGEIDAKRKADKSAAKIFTDMGGFAPTIGIIGTVMGLVHVLSSLSDPSKLVYSAHDYSPKVWQQSWFTDPAFPDNLPALWDSMWGYLAAEKHTPVLLGEFGGRHFAPIEADLAAT